MNKALGRTLGGLLVAAAVISSGSPAFAASDETGAPAAATSSEVDSGIVTPQSNPDCKGQWAFTNTSVKADHIGRVGSPSSNYFGNGGTMALSTGYSGTVGASASVSVSAEASAAMFKVAATINGTVTTSAGVTTTNTATFSVPAGKWGNGVYGRYRIAVTGDSYQLSAPVCAHTNQKRVTYYVAGLNKPVGWCTWVSTNSLGSRPAACDDGSPYIP